MSIESRLIKLESVIPLRCRTCGHTLTCNHCLYGRNLHECTDQELLSIITSGMERLGKDPNLFKVFGYDLNRLEVAELKELRRLLDKMDDSPTEVTP
jgi:hypothetical protein